MLPQLVGLKCSRCQREIEAVSEGRFCSECGNPVHFACQQLDAPPCTWRCRVCSGNPDDPIAVAVRRVTDPDEEQSAAATPFSSSELLPQRGRRLKNQVIEAPRESSPFRTKYPISR